MKHHKGKEEKSTSCAKQQRAPAGEKGRGVLDGRWSRSRAPTEGVSPSLGLIDEFIKNVGEAS